MVQQTTPAPHRQVCWHGWRARVDLGAGKTQAMSRDIFPTIVPQSPASLKNFWNTIMSCDYCDILEPCPTPPGNALGKGCSGQ